MTNAASLPLILLMVALLLVLLAGFMLWYDTARTDLERRVAVISDAAAPTMQAASAGSPAAWLVGGLRSLGEGIRARTRIFSAQEINDFERTVAAAGFNPKGFVSALIGVKVVLMVVAPVVTYAVCIWLEKSANNTILAVLIAAAGGVLGPNWLLQLLRRPYLKALNKGIPDALDLMVICTEAGQGLETAVNQVAKEMAYSNRAIAVEFSTLSHELQVLPDRSQALANMGDRSGADGLKRLASILAQTMQYGTPLVQGLRSVSAELRRERMIALEAKAARLPALMVLPMIFFIMPCLFIVLMGPSILRLMDALVGYSK
jgi:tight adherence protein C